MEINKPQQTKQVTALQDVQHQLSCFEEQILPLIPSKEVILTRAKQRQIERQYKVKILGIAVFSLLGILACIYGLNPAYEQYEIKTLKGEQRSVSFGDGSEIQLNTNTHIQVQQRLRSREFQLNWGEASFSVTHMKYSWLNPFERRFEVIAGNMQIVDIGTVFNVEKINQTDARVAVIEGEVAVKIKDSNQPMRHLKQGQSLSNSQRDLTQPINLNIDQVSAWQSGQIVFEQTPLTEALQDFQRYADFEVQFSPSDLDDISLSGQFKINNYQQFMQILPKVAPVSVEQLTEQEWIVRKN